MNERESAQGAMHGKGISKVEQYSWGVLDKPGKFAWVNKSDLNIDHTYQRDKVSKIRVASIRRDWSWVACGVLIVAERKDGTMWVMDGQHRKLAADDRHDVQQLPCIVFDSTETKDEALGFYRANTVRGPVDSYSKFKAMLKAGDPIAMCVNKMVQSTGYEMAQTGGPFKVACSVRLMNCYQSDPMITQDVWRLIAEVCNGEPPNERVVGGLFLVEAKLKENGGSLNDKHYLKTLKDAGAAGINEAISKTLAYYGKGGERYYAEGIVQLLNKRRSSRRVPSFIRT